MSQPTTCFGLFYFGHLQVGYLGQRKYTIVLYNHWSQGGRDLVYKNSGTPSPFRILTSLALMDKNVTTD